MLPALGGRNPFQTHSHSAILMMQHASLHKGLPHLYSVHVTMDKWSLPKLKPNLRLWVCVQCVDVLVRWKIGQLFNLQSKVTVLVSLKPQLFS